MPSQHPSVARPASVPPVAGKPAPGPGTWIGRAALAVTAVLAARSAVRVTREISEFAALRQVLATEWSRIAGIAGTRALRIHARVGRPTRSTLPAIVLVHGYGVGGRQWLPVAARLAAHAPVLVPDLPGHGASHHDQRPLRVAEMSHALAAWADGRGLTRVVFVGHGLGCLVVAQLAERRPDLAAGLVLIGPARDTTSGPAPRPGSRVPLFGRLSAAMHGALEPADDPTRGFGEALRPVDEERLDDVLRRVSAPVRLVRGERDSAAPQAWMRLLARVAGAPPPIVIARAGHSVHDDDPEAVARVVLDLADGVSSAEAAGERARGADQVRPGDSIALRAWRY